MKSCQLLVLLLLVCRFILNISKLINILARWIDLDRHLAVSIDLDRHLAVSIDLDRHLAVSIDLDRHLAVSIDVDRHLAVLIIFTLLVLHSSIVSLSYFILAGPMRKCCGLHLCVSSPFPVALLNGTFFSLSVRAMNNWQLSAIKQILLN